MNRTLRLILICVSLHGTTLAHERHPAAKDYVPPAEPVVIGEGNFRYRLVNTSVSETQDQ